MMRIATVTVDRNGPVVINKADFRPGVDRLYSEPASVGPRPNPVAEPAVDPDEAGRLIAILAERGIKKDRRASVETLRKLVAETDA